MHGGFSVDTPILLGGVLLAVGVGGLATDSAAVRSAALPAAVLATVGVAITGGVVALIAGWVFDLSATTALLLGAVVASISVAVQAPTVGLLTKRLGFGAQ